MIWQPMKTAPRDGTNILLRWGSDGVSQGKYIPGLPKPWQFIDTQDGITWLINHAVDNEYGPTHWTLMPPSKTVEPVAWLYRDDHGTLKLAQTEPPPDGAFPVFACGVLGTFNTEEN